MQNKSLIKQRILQFIDYQGFTKYKFYKSTGITRGILDHETGMSESNTTKFLVAFPEVRPEWLVTGKGEMIRESNTAVLSEPEEIMNPEKTRVYPLLKSLLLPDLVI